MTAAATRGNGAATVRPFSSGSEYSAWGTRNCKAGCRRYSGPDAAPTCDLDGALLRAYATDGLIPLTIAERMGWTTAEPYGRLAIYCPEADHPVITLCPQCQINAAPDGPRCPGRAAEVGP